MTNDFVEALPRSGGGRGRSDRYREFSANCRKKPYVWGKFPRDFETKNQCSNTTSSIKRGEYADFRPVGDWEAVQRAGVVYVRYVGKGSNGD